MIENSKTNTDAKLNEALSGWSTSIIKDDLAYSCITSKSERYIQDSIALYIHKQYFEDFIVMKEHGRADIALFKKDEPTTKTPFCTMEITFAYSCDLIIQNPYDPLSKLIRDHDKNKKRFPSSASYSLLFVAHNNHNFNDPIQFTRILKYLPIQRSAWRFAGKDHEVTKERAKTAVVDWTKTQKVLNPVCCGRIEGGSAFNIAVSLDYWLATSNPNNCPAQ